MNPGIPMPMLQVFTLPMAMANQGRVPALHASLIVEKMAPPPCTVPMRKPGPRYGSQFRNKFQPLIYLASYRYDGGSIRYSGWSLHDIVLRLRGLALFLGGEFASPVSRGCMPWGRSQDLAMGLVRVTLRTQHLTCT